TSALLRRAARYVGPARTGLESLVLQTQRLATWLSPAVRQPSLQPVAVNSWLAEIVSLSRDSTRALEIEMESALTDEVRLAADLSRLSQALLRWMLTHAA